MVINVWRMMIKKKKTVKAIVTITLTIRPRRDFNVNRMDDDIGLNT